MKKYLSEELTLLTAKLMLCNSKREIIGLSNEFGQLIEKVIENEKKSYPHSSEAPEKAITATIKFTKTEVAYMAKTFKKEFMAHGLVAHVIKRESGKNSFCYEIRYRKNGYNISASSTNLEEAKEKFIFMTSPQQIEKYYIETKPFSKNIPTTFTSFALYFFEKKRKNSVAEKTYRNDFNRLKKYLIPKFKEIPLHRITLDDCQDIVDAVMDEEKYKTAQELHNIMRLIFRFAVDNYLINKNPANAIITLDYEQENGIALTEKEEELLFNNTLEENIKTAFAIHLYCGVRPNELPSCEIVGDFIKALNSKRHKKKRTKIQSNKEYKYIPIIDKLKPFLKNGIPSFPSAQVLRKKIKTILPKHQLYDLRTTFQTRCISFGISEIPLKLMMGHSLGKLGNAYTDVEQLKVFLLKECEKLKIW